MDPRVTRGVALMEQHLGSPMRMAELAREVGLSTSRFTRLFRRETGMTPRRYQHDLRLRRAEALIAQTALSIREVMVQVGIKHPGHFAREFRRYHGCNPRAVPRRGGLSGS